MRHSFSRCVLFFPFLVVGLWSVTLLWFNDYNDRVSRAKQHADLNFIYQVTSDWTTPPFIDIMIT